MTCSKNLSYSHFLLRLQAASSRHCVVESFTYLAITSVTTLSTSTKKLVRKQQENGAAHPMLKSCFLLTWNIPQTCSAVIKLMPKPASWKLDFSLNPSVWNIQRSIARNQDLPNRFSRCNVSTQFPTCCYVEKTFRKNLSQCSNRQSDSQFGGSTPWEAFLLLKFQMTV